MPNLSNISSQLLVNEIKLSLSTFGMSEAYHSFNFLTDIIFYMIKHNDDSLEIYQKSIKLLAEKYNLTERSIINGLQYILKHCETKIKSKIQFNLTKNSTLNKIRVVKNIILDKLKL